ncbi:glycosyltransferase involved in cell wall biosynthesis [Halarchaeum rubridurum]|uniref:Glycosyl transferase n=1 Tax=Halarchaeum rubridurum TaxID=489911 RepID=A0A830FY41_9EURY|nr:glycosyltransferase family 2 protein [Halarchaeum rubridurum]MBP1953467.1 glycosyltransferase involved in cell wall biosynthesis [Halarchaeum rubridurum]GGM65051.1 glycosyl transferase [Halarchaeum rubridurum]
MSDDAESGGANDGAREDAPSAPRVSVVVPAYRRADVLPRAIDSALAQTVGDLEVVVVDDGSPDDTEAVVRAYDDPRVRYVAHGTNRGVSAARNTGIEHARGAYVAFLDSDDEWLPRKLERQLAALDAKGAGWVGVYCDYATVGGGLGARLAALVSERVFHAGAPREGGRELAESLLTMRVFMGPGSTLLVARDALDGLAFDEGLSIYEDWDLVLRLLARGKLAHVAEPLAVVHDTGDAPADAYARNDRRYLERNADLVADLRDRGVDVARVHRMGLVGHYLHEGRFRDALRYLDSGVLSRPGDLLRLAWWSVVGVRALARRPGDE